MLLFDEKTTNELTHHILPEKADCMFASQQRRVHNHQEKTDVSAQFAAMARTQPISVIDPIFISARLLFFLRKT
jgi:hypothetical protein